VPLIYVAQPHGGMDPAQMEGFLVNYHEYHFPYSTGIEHVESKSIQGTTPIKLQFRPARIWRRAAGCPQAFFLHVAPRLDTGVNYVTR